MCCVPVRMIHYNSIQLALVRVLVLGTRWFGYELVVGTSWSGYELRYELAWVRVGMVRLG